MHKSAPLLNARQNFIDKADEVIIALDAAVKGHTELCSWGPEANRTADQLGTMILAGAKVKHLGHGLIRATIRSQATSLYNVRAGTVPKIMLISTSLRQMRDKYWGFSHDLNTFRFIAERVAILLDIHRYFSSNLNDYRVKKFDELIGIGNGVREMGSGTRFSWRESFHLPFEEMKDTDYVYDQENDLSDMSAKSILSSIDRSSKRELIGLRAFYNFCCEFVHPNLGDAVAAGSNLKIFKAEDGEILRKRKLSSSFDLISDQVVKVNSAEMVLLENAYAFATKMITLLPETADQIASVLSSSERVSRVNIHKVVKIQRQVFKKDDLCPCGSGRNIKLCSKLN